MKDLSTLLQTDLSGLNWEAWCDKLNDLAGDDGYCEPLGPDHAALLIEKKPTLLVTFETRPGIEAGQQMGQPMAWPLTEALGWSHMALFADHETWFRDPHVYAYFDRLIDEGFFEEFDEVIFYGAGSCGYAACAFSVAAPGARVLALQPQATMDPRRAGWDTRFAHARRLDFTQRFGYAPDMLAAADHAWIAYNPQNTFDAMHASLLAGEPLGKADAALIRAQTGFAIGGVSPVGHLTPPRAFFDPRLLTFDEVWAAAGTPRHVYAISPQDLLRVSKATEADFTV